MRYLWSDTHPDHASIGKFRTDNGALLAANIRHVLERAARERSSGHRPRGKALKSPQDKEQLQPTAVTLSPVIESGLYSEAAVATASPGLAHGGNDCWLT